MRQQTCFGDDNKKKKIKNTAQSLLGNNVCGFPACFLIFFSLQPKKNDPLQWILCAKRKNIFFDF